MPVDPGAVYQENLANLQLVADNENAALGEREGNLKANTGYAENEITRVEPGTLRSAAHAANKGGILNSGIQARRQTDIANTFAARRTGNAMRLAQGLQGINKGREGVGLKQKLGISGFAQKRAQEEDALQARFPTLPAEPAPPAAPAAPGPTITPGGIPAGGWGDTGNQGVRVNPGWGNTGNRNVRVGNPNAPNLRAEELARQRRKR